MINAIQDMKDCIKHALSEDFLKKNKLINKYIKKKYNINVYWS